MRLNQTIGLFFIFNIALVIFFWTPEGIRTARAAQKSETPPQGGEIDRLFKTLGIIKLAGIAPPMDIELKDPTGKKVRVTDFKGKVVFLNFWTTWCPECRFEMPSMEKLHQHFKDDDLVVLAVNLQESARRVETFFKKYNLTFTALLDTNGRAGKRFGIRSIPTTFILNKKGGLIGKALGSRKWEGEPSISLFNTLLSVHE